jgi:hypothetical protein
MIDHLRGKPVRTDRRRALRYVAFFPVKIASAGETERLGICREMSRSGGVMMTQTALNAGQRIDLLLYLSDNEVRPTRVGARVVRLTPRSLRRGWNFDTAVEFDDLQVEAEPALDALSTEQQRAGTIRARKA